MVGWLSLQGSSDQSRGLDQIPMVFHSERAIVHHKQCSSQTVFITNSEMRDHPEGFHIQD